MKKNLQSVELTTAAEKSGVSSTLYSVTKTDNSKPGFFKSMPGFVFKDNE